VEVTEELGDIGEDGMIILKRILKKYDIGCGLDSCVSG
jgi:hypothetical protein